jgi:hypothetical protein
VDKLHHFEIAPVDVPISAACARGHRHATIESSCNDDCTVLAPASCFVVRSGSHRLYPANLRRGEDIGSAPRTAPPSLPRTFVDRGQLQSVEKAREYQALIANSRLVVLRSDGYHIAASNADECVTNVLGFIKDARHRA